MIRYALVIVAAVVFWLWYSSRTAAQTRAVTGRQPAPSPWAMLGQLLGGAIAGGAQAGARPSADAVYGRLGNPSPTAITAATNYSTSSVTEKPNPVYRADSPTDWQSFYAGASYAE